MSHNSLAETYSRSSGAKLNKPFIYISPYSLPFEKYLVVAPSSGNENKNYSYFSEVIDFILPALKSLNIHIVQIGESKDSPLDHVYHLQGKTNIAQTAFIIKNSLLLIGNDSMPAHLAGILDVPVISLYGPTSVDNHGPYWHNSKSIFIESHRNGNKPSFHFNENPKTVNFIKPEEVVRAIATILGIKLYQNFESIYFGDRFVNKVVETVLDALVPENFISNAPLNIRYDYLAAEESLARQLSVRKSLIVTDKTIDLRLINQFKSQIIGVAYSITDNNDPKFIESVQKLGIPITLISKLSEDKINDYKLDYAEIGLIQPEKVKVKQDIKDFHKIDSNTLFRTKKILLSGGKIYPSNAHRLLDIPIEDGKPLGGKVLDTPKFFEELDYFYFYNNKLD